MILHTLNATPGSQAFADCLRLARAGDAILLLGDGVYAAMAGAAASQQLADHAAEIYVLREDAEMAGVTVAEDTVAVDMAGFVELSERFPRQLAWY